MSRSQIVDQRYRLQSADLQGTPVQVMITAVSYQGLEELTPVLHLAGGSFKHLTLAPEQRRALIRVTKSTFCADWVGCQIELQPAFDQSQAALLIVAPGSPRPWRMLTLSVGPIVSTFGRAVWPLLLVGLVLCIVFLLEQYETLFEQILSLFP